MLDDAEPADALAKGLQPGNDVRRQEPVAVVGEIRDVPENPVDEKDANRQDGGRRRLDVLAGEQKSDAGDGGHAQGQKSRAEQVAVQPRPVVKNRKEADVRRHDEEAAVRFGQECAPAP